TQRNCVPKSSKIAQSRRGGALSGLRFPQSSDTALWSSLRSLPASHLPLRPRRAEEQGRGGERAGCCRSCRLGARGSRRTFSGAMLGQSIRRFTTSVVRRSHYEEGPGKNLPFSVENKWRLLLMMTLYFGSGFAAPFFIVRHQLLKK
uniref:Cytochrome c oxidase subunit 7C, mitochondrial n=9 Tax=Caniformia TaxID=379584 RepID=A0A8P0PI45_CANLF